MAPKLLVVGGGFAGSKLAIQLSKEFDVTLVDRKPYFEINFANARALVEPDLTKTTVVPFDAMKPHGTYIQGTVTKLTDKQAWLEGVAEPLSFDYAAICSGSDYSYGKSTAPTAEGVQQEYQSLNERVKGAKRVLVVGGGSLGVELAGEICTDHPTVQVTLVQSQDSLLPDMPPKAGAAALTWLKKHGCEVLLGDKVQASPAQVQQQAAPHKLTTTSGKEVEADVVLFATGIRVNSSFLSDELAGCKDPTTGAIKVNPHLQVVDHPNMFALGDVTDVPEGKLAFLANKHADVAATNLRALAKAGATGAGAAPPKLTSWKPAMGMPVQLVSIGRNYGVARFGSWTISGWMPTYIKSRGVAGMTLKFRKEALA